MEEGDGGSALVDVQGVGKGTARVEDYRQRA